MTLEEHLARIVEEALEIYLQPNNRESLERIKQRLAYEAGFKDGARSGGSR